MTGVIYFNYITTSSSYSRQRLGDISRRAMELRDAI